MKKKTKTRYGVYVCNCAWSSAVPVGEKSPLRSLTLGTGSNPSNANKAAGEAAALFAYSFFLVLSCLFRLLGLNLRPPCSLGSRDFSLGGG
jgi:hypothetical protein